MPYRDFILLFGSALAPAALAGADLGKRVDGVGALWTPSRKTTNPSIPYLPIGAREIISGVVADSGRDFDTPSQDLVLYLTEAYADTALSVGNPATGYTVYVNGASSVPTYRSGSGTATWTLRIPVLVKNGDVVQLSYSSTGATIAVGDSVELTAATKMPIENTLTKRLRFTLKDKNDALVVSESVQVSVHEYGSGSPANATWMERTNYGSITTTAAGVVDALYSGTLSVGGTAYVVVYRPTATESMAWTQTIT